MKRMLGIMVLYASTTACGGLFGGDPLEQDCVERKAWYPDANGDGIGDNDTVYVGCGEPPEGWTQIPPYPPDSGDTEDPEDTEEVEDSEPADSEGAEDTELDDTEPLAP